MTSPPLLLLDPARRKEGKTARSASPERADGTARRILCRACRTELSDREAVFAMRTAGATGVFVNPHGFLHEVLTVRRAVNVLPAGMPTAEFTWFPGYAWEIVLCATCHEHVGWQFTASLEREPSLFWGLRRPAIVEEEGS